MAKMIGKHAQVCRLGTCRCSNANDSKGKVMERRLAKRRDKVRFILDLKEKGGEDV